MHDLWCAGLKQSSPKQRPRLKRCAQWVRDPLFEVVTLVGDLKFALGPKGVKPRLDFNGTSESPAPPVLVTGIQSGKQS